MEIGENMNELIEKYLANEMSVREQTAFENLLRNNPALMDEFLLRKKVNEAIIEDDIMNLRDDIDEITSTRTFTTRKRSVFYSLAAAIIAILVVVGTHFFMPQKTNDGNQLFASYYTSYPSVLNLRSASDISNEERLTRDAFGYYDQGNFKKAAGHFKNLLTFDSTNHMAIFYLAISYIEMEKYTDAENYLHQLLNNKNQIFWEQSHWYLSLVYLKQDKPEKAKELLQTIVYENFFRASEANEILAQID